MLWLVALFMVVLFGGLMAWSVFAMEKQTRQVAGVSADSAHIFREFGSAVGAFAQRVRSSVIAGLIGFAVITLAIMVAESSSGAAMPALVAIIVYFGAVGMMLRTWWYPVVSTVMFLIVACAAMVVIGLSGEWNTMTMSGHAGTLAVQLTIIYAMVVAALTAVGTLIGSGIAALLRRTGAAGHS
jgi:hypothetical protein